MSHWPPDYCFQQLQKHKAVIAAAADKNEADTRRLAIDTVLVDVLGWDKLDIETESYVKNVGFLDYGLSVDGTVSMIVEAKRHELPFVLPDIAFPVGAAAFGLLAKECTEADKALRQAITYATSFGVRYVAITNGHQWSLSLSFVPNQCVSDRHVIVFESLEAIEKQFRSFWECFSPAGVSANRVLNLLMDVRKAPPPRKLSQRIDVYPAPTHRNQIADELGTVLGAVWEEVNHDEDEIEFLKQCYVVPEASTSALALAKSVRKE